MITEINVIKNDIPSEIIRNLKILYSTPEGTVVADRNFGINMSIQDNPINLAKAKLVSEYIMKTKKYEPRVKVKEVLFDIDFDGSLKSKVVIDWN